MASKHLMAALLGTALLSAPALAQTQSPAPAATPNAASSTMSAGNWMTQERAGQWRASKIEGLNVYNDANVKIGDISELLVDQTGKVEAEGKGPSVAKFETQIEKLDQRIATAKTQSEDRENNKEVALGTSKIVSFSSSSDLPPCLHFGMKLLTFLSELHRPASDGRLHQEVQCPY